MSSNASNEVAQADIDQGDGAGVSQDAFSEFIRGDNS